jgi:hypothetical protein
VDDRPDEQIAVIDGVATTIKVAHVRLSHSRMVFVRAYPREVSHRVAMRSRPMANGDGV